MAVMLYVWYPLSLLSVEDLLSERGVDICHETVRFWWNGFGPLFAAEIRRRRVNCMRGFRHWRWHIGTHPKFIESGCVGRPFWHIIVNRSLERGERHEFEDNRLPQVAVRIGLLLGEPTRTYELADIANGAALVRRLEQQQVAA